MDPLKSKEAEEENDQNKNPLVVTTNAGEVCLQLEGSHTTSTETEAVFSTSKKNVKFEDEEKDDEKDVSEEISEQKITDELKEEGEEEEEQKEEIEEKAKDELSALKPENSNELLLKSLSPELSQETVIQMTEELSAVCDLQKFKDPSTTEVLANEQADQEKLQNTSIQSVEISKHIEKIMEMFDSVTRNLENFECVAEPKTLADVSTIGYSRKRPKSIASLKDLSDQEEPHKHRSRYDDYYKDCESKSDRRDFKIAIEPELPSSVSASTSCAELIAKSYAEEMTVKELQNAAEEKKAINARSISTATSSCELKSLGCQTQLSDHISFNELSILEGSSFTSRSEQPNSLNNYAQAENACVSLYGSQPQITKQPMLEALIQEPAYEMPAIVQESPTEQRFSITIEANATPSATDLQRAPFCHRLWEVIADFCAATLLCLQVNRDCIFCIGFFFVAFVVSASFLTAFFYHTLIISPTLWQVEAETVL